MPTYLFEPLDRQSPSRLEAVATYASSLAAWKRRKGDDEGARKRTEESVDAETLDRLDNRGVSIDPDDYDPVPENGAYITIKETKPGYRYYYWQWRAGDTWENEYIAPVDPKRDSGTDG